MSPRKPKPTNNHIPDDVTFNILARLPVKSLIRFRCVCKSWYSSITSPYFISTHLNISNSKDHGYIINVPNFVRQGELCEVFCDRTYDSISEHPLPSGFGCFHVGAGGRLGLSNGLSSYGLLCLPYYGTGSTCVDAIYLYNPGIRKFKRLPDSSLSNQYYGCWVADGFGYHSEPNDYKVVKIYVLLGFLERGMTQIQPQYAAEVYTLSSNSWKRVGISLPPNLRVYYIEFYSHATFASGALHWLVEIIESEEGLQHETKILSCDVYNEKFRVIALPNGDRTDQKYVDVFNGKLAFITRDFECNYYIWAMGEYGGVHESWSKLFSLQMGIGIFCGFTRYGELIVQKDFHSPDEYVLNLIDPETLHETHLVTKHCPSRDTTYMESLVLLGGETELSG